MEGERVMEGIQLRLTEMIDDFAPAPAVHEDSTEPEHTPLRFPDGGVFGLDRSAAESAADALERIELALHEMSKLADEQDAADAQLNRLMFGDDNEPPRAA